MIDVNKNFVSSQDIHPYEMNKIDSNLSLLGTQESNHTTPIIKSVQIKTDYQTKNLDAQVQILIFFKITLEDHHNLKFQ